MMMCNLCLLTSGQCVVVLVVCTAESHKTHNLTGTMPFRVLMCAAGKLSSNPLKAFAEMPPLGAVQIVIFCGLLELFFAASARMPDYQAGDYYGMNAMLEEVSARPASTCGAGFAFFCFWSPSVQILDGSCWILTIGVRMCV